MRYVSFKNKIAFVVAVLFHFFGAIGILFTSYRQWFINLTPLNIILMAVLLIWTHPYRNSNFFLFMLIAFFTGIITEVIGVQTGMLFGDYAYGAILGTGFKGVPLIIGLNWFIVIYCAAAVIDRLHQLFSKAVTNAGETKLSPTLHAISFVVDGALLATFFDFILEPAAIKLCFWSWLSNGEIPFFNYVCWFVISSFLLTVFRLLKLNKHNYFAVHLFIIQLLFFLLLRTFL